MKVERRAVFSAVLLVLGAALGVGLISQRQQAALSRVEYDAMQFEMRELDRLRAENLRLRALQIPMADLEQLRADHAALPRLRAELEALKAP
jgi:hypothetical protein